VTGGSLGRAMRPDTLVAYEMNGVPLPPRHGYPARILVPGTYGEVNVKWIDRIELTDRSVQGYYERQGWRPGTVRTMSRIDRPPRDVPISLARTASVPVGGVAFAGDRGISRVEVTADAGLTWQQATI